MLAKPVVTSTDRGKNHDTLIRRIIVWQLNANFDYNIKLNILNELFDTISFVKYVYIYL